MSKATLTRQGKSLDSKSLLIHAKMYSDSLAVYKGKSIWISCLLVFTQTLFSYLRMDVNRYKFH